MARRSGVDVSARLLVVLRVRRGGDHAVGDHLGAQGEALVERLPHGLEARRTEDERGPVVGVADPQLAQQFGADEGLAQTDHISDVAAAVDIDHGQAAAHPVQLEVGQFLRALGRQLRGADVGMVQLVESLQVYVVRRRPGDGPGALQLD